MNKELMAYIEKNRIVDHNTLIEYAESLGPEYVQVVKAQPYQYQQMLSSNQRANRVIEDEMLNDMMDNPDEYDFGDNEILEEETIIEEDTIIEPFEEETEEEPSVDTALVDSIVAKVVAEVNQSQLSDDILASIRAKVEEELKNQSK